MINYRENIQEKENIAMQKHYTLLYRYCNTVEYMLPHIKTENPYHAYTSKKLNDIHQDICTLYERLAHCNCKLNYLHRVEIKSNTFEVSRDDLSVALTAIQKLMKYESPKILLDKRIVHFYNNLEEKFYNQEFTSRQASLVLKNRERRTAQYYLKKLYDVQLLEMTFHHNRLGHRYKVRYS